MCKFRIHACLFMLAFAQISSAQDVVWRKLVAREIKVSGKEDKRPHDPTLLDMLVGAVQSGKLAAYSGIDNKFTGRLTLTEFNQTIGSYQPDTVAITDPLTGKETIKIIKHDIDQDAITKYRILEEWSFDRAIGITNIRIIGIAPLMDVYGNDFEAVKALFWIKYSDAADILNKQARSYPEKAFINILLRDYFGSDISKAQLSFTNTWMGRKSRILDLDPETFKTYSLKNSETDSSLSDIISYKIDKSELNIYDSSSKLMQRAAVYPAPDTIILVDPVTGQEVMKLVKYSYLFYGRDPKYKLMEDWTFAPAQGIIQIKIAYIVPFGKNHNDIDAHYPEAPYWLKFDDISGILAKYEYSHYNNSLANLLWDDYFLKEEATPKKK